jgi:hypothetical protein
MLSVITLSVEVPLLEGLDHLWNQRELVKYFIFLGIASSMATVMGPQSHLEQLHCPHQELQLGVSLIKLFFTIHSADLMPLRTMTKFF